MKNALIFHGTNNNSQGNWFQWLKKELENLGYEVLVPDLPDASQPDINKYFNFLKNFNFNSETILIGHSSGASAIFGILNKLSPNIKINLVFSIAGFYKDDGFNCQNLFTESFDWEKIKKQAKKFFIIWSTNDPYISEKQTNYLSEHLNVKPIIFENKKHFNLEADKKFKQFPELLEIIKNNI